MFVPYFLFLNVKFNVTVPPIYYHTKIAPRIKGYLDIPQTTHAHTKKPETQYPWQLITLHNSVYTE